VSLSSDYLHGRPFEFFQEGAGARGLGERGARAYNGGLGGGASSSVQGQSPCLGGQGRPSEAESFESFAHLQMVKNLLPVYQDRLNMALADSKKRYHA